MQFLVLKWVFKIFRSLFKRSCMEEMLQNKLLTGFENFLCFLLFSVIEKRKSKA